MTVPPPSTRSGATWFVIILVLVLLVTWLIFQGAGNETPTEPNIPQATATLPPADEGQELPPTSTPLHSPLPTGTPVPSPYPLAAPTEPAAAYPLPTMPPPTAYPVPEG